MGEFKSQGFLAPAMVNYLSLLGWNDGSEQEIFSIDELSQRFSLERITKSPAVFDKVKLGWMNGQHLKALPEAEQLSMVGAALVADGVVKAAGTPFVDAAIKLVGKNLVRTRDGGSACLVRCRRARRGPPWGPCEQRSPVPIPSPQELVADASAQVRSLLEYPLAETLASPEAKSVVDDNFGEVAQAVLDAHASGALAAALAQGHDGYKAWVNGVGKAQKRKGKRLFMPMRVAFTGRMQVCGRTGSTYRGAPARVARRQHAPITPAQAAAALLRRGRAQGADVGDQLDVLAKEAGDASPELYVNLPQRMERLAQWLAQHKQQQ